MKLRILAIAISISELRFEKGRQWPFGVSARLRAEANALTSRYLRLLVHMSIGPAQNYVQDQAKHCNGY